VPTEVGRDGQVAHEIAVLLDPHGAYRNVGAAADEVEQRGAQGAGKTLVDDLERVQAAADDALLVGQVVRTHAAIVGDRRACHGRIGFARYAFQ